MEQDFDDGEAVVFDIQPEDEDYVEQKLQDGDSEQTILDFEMSDLSETEKDSVPETTSTESRSQAPKEIFTERPPPRPLTQEEIADWGETTSLSPPGKASLGAPSGKASLMVSEKTTETTKNLGPRGAKGEVKTTPVSAKAKTKKGKAGKAKKTKPETEFSKQNIDAFSAIVSFLKDLLSIFGGTNVTPLALYTRLVDHIKFTDHEAIMKSIEGFSKFFDKYGKDVFEGNLQNIPQGTRILYGEGNTAYILIQMYIHRATPDVREAIRQHLMTIAAFIQPEKIVRAEPAASRTGPGPAGLAGGPAGLAGGPAMGIDLSTTEGKFIDGIMKKANTSMENVDASNPMMATMALFQSGIMGDMMTGLQQGVSGGEMDIVKLMGMMQGAMSQMMKTTEGGATPATATSAATANGGGGAARANQTSAPSRTSQANQTSAPKAKSITGRQGAGNVKGKAKK